MKKIFFTIIIIALANKLYAQEKDDWKWYSIYQFEELRQLFGDSFADSVKNAIYITTFSSYEKEENQILNARKLSIHGDVQHDDKNEIYICEKNGNVYIQDNYKPYPLSPLLEYLNYIDGPLPDPFGLDTYKKTLKELKISEGCYYVSNIRSLFFDFSDFDRVQYFTFNIRPYQMIKGRAKFLRKNACELKFPPNLIFLSYSGLRSVKISPFPKTIEELEIINCDFLPKQIFGLPKLKILFVDYYKESYQPLSKFFLNIDSLHTIKLSILKEKDIEILSQMPHLDTLILKTPEWIRGQPYVLPNNFDKLINIRYIRVLGGTSPDGSPSLSYGGLIKKTLPNTTVVIGDGIHLKEL